MILVDANLLVYAHSARSRNTPRLAEGRANLVPDAHIAALAIERVTLASGFRARFIEAPSK